MSKLNAYLCSIFSGLESTFQSGQFASVFVYTFKFIFAGQATIFIGLGIKLLLGYEITERLDSDMNIGIGILYLLILWRTHVFIKNRTNTKKYKYEIFSPTKAWVHFFIGTLIIISPSILFIIMFTE